MGGQPRGADHHSGLQERLSAARRAGSGPGPDTTIAAFNGGGSGCGGVWSPHRGLGPRRRPSSPPRRHARFPLPVPSHVCLVACPFGLVGGLPAPTAEPCGPCRRAALGAALPSGACGAGCLKPQRNAYADAYPVPSTSSRRRQRFLDASRAARGRAGVHGGGIGCVARAGTC